MVNFKIKLSLVCIFIVCIFTLSVFAQDEACSRGISGTIDDTNVEDNWSLLGIEGDQVIIRLFDPNNELDTLVRLLNDSDEIIAENDDGGDRGRLNSEIIATLPYTGTYTVQVTRYQEGDGTTEGSYIVYICSINMTATPVFDNPPEPFVTVPNAAPQPQDFFTEEWEPPWLELLANYYDDESIENINGRVRVAVTVASPEENDEFVEFVLTIDAENEEILNEFLTEASVYFALRSTQSFNLVTDSLILDECPIPANMVIGRIGYILEDPPVGNRVREEPSLDSNEIDVIEPGAEFDVIDGPVCNNNINWWYVSYTDSEGWIAEGESTNEAELYYAETYPEISVDISANVSEDTSGTNVLYFYIDPVVSFGETHRYISTATSSMSFRTNVSIGETRLALWRYLPTFGYFRAATVAGGEYSPWFQHDSGDIEAEYSARVTGRGNSDSTYTVFGTMTLD